MTTPKPAELVELPEPMYAAMVEADFKKNHVTFEMRGDYVCTADLYEIRPHNPTAASLAAHGRVEVTEAARLSLSEMRDERNYSHYAVEVSVQTFDRWLESFAAALGEPHE